MLSAIAADPRRWQAPRLRVNWHSPQAAGLSMWWSMRWSAMQALVDEPLQNAYGTITGTISNIFWASDPDLGPGVHCAAGYIAGPASNFSAPLTVAVWCRPNFTNAIGVNAFGKLFTKAHTSVTDPYALVAMGVDAGSPAHWNTLISTGGSGSGISVTSTATITAESLSHVALTYDGVTLRQYVNGSVDGSINTTLTIGSNAVAFTVGSLGTYTLNNLWGGLILDVRWYTRALSDVDMWQLYDPATRWDLYAPGLMPSVSRSAAIVPPLFSLQPRLFVVT